MRSSLLLISDGAAAICRVSSSSVNSILFCLLWICIALGLNCSAPLLATELWAQQFAASLLEGHCCCKPATKLTLSLVVVLVGALSICTFDGLEEQQRACSIGKGQSLCNSAFNVWRCRNKFLTDFLLTCSGCVFCTVNPSMQLNCVDERRGSSYVYLFGVEDSHLVFVSLGDPW